MRTRDHRDHRAVGTSIAEARGLDAHAVAVMDLALRAADGPRRDDRVLALRDEYGPALREARVAVAHSLGTAADLGRERHAGASPRSFAPVLAAALGVAPLVVALAVLAAGLPFVASAALGLVLWIASRPLITRLERGPLYAHGAPRISRAGAKYLYGDLIDAHAAELLDGAGAPAAHVDALRSRWDAGMAALLAWRCALETHDAAQSPTGAPHLPRRPGPVTSDTTSLSPLYTGWDHT